MPELESLFPGLRGTEYRVTSPADSRYNCLAWVAGDQSRWWWPDAESYWPYDEYRFEWVSCFLQTFSLMGFRECDIVDMDDNDYIAIFANDEGRVLHAARRLRNGRWTSKLGVLVDIEHDLHALEGIHYGKVEFILTRPQAS